MCLPLHAAKTKKARFLRTSDMEVSFKELKHFVIIPPVLGFPCFDSPFIVETDALSVSVGAILSQKSKDE